MATIEENVSNEHEPASGLGEISTEKLDGVEGVSVLLIQLDHTALTVGLIENLFAKFTGEVGVVELSGLNSEKNIVNIATSESISKRSTGPIKVVSGCAVLNVVTANAWLLTQTESETIEPGMHVMIIKPAHVLIFCGHSQHSGGLTSYLKKEHVEKIIKTVDPTVVSFFGCDVGRPRDSFILELSHSHEPKTGPIYAAFVRKVNEEDLLNTAVLHGLLQFVAQCAIPCPESGAVVDRYDLAKLSFAVAIASRPASGDCGMFFNDTRELTTVQQFMNLASTKMNENQLPTSLNIARYHVWTWGGKEITHTCLQKLQDATLSSSVDSILVEAMNDLGIAQVMNLADQAKDLHLTVATVKRLSEGKWDTLEPKDVCAGIYNGYWGRMEFSVIVQQLLYRLFAAEDVDTFSLVAATLLVTTENSYVMQGREELTIKYVDKSNSASFVFTLGKMVRHCVGTTEYTHKDPFPIGMSVIEAFSLDEYFNTVDHLYQYCRNSSPAFGRLYRGEANSISLQCGASLLLPFKINMSPRPAYKFTTEDLHRVVTAVVARVRYIASVADSERAGASKDDFTHENCIFIKWFGNELVPGIGQKRFSVFPKNGVDESLWFLEIYPLQGKDYERLYRCRFLTALPMRLLTYEIEELAENPTVTGHMFYTDSHYGQDVYGAAKAQLSPKSLPDLGQKQNYNWVDYRDYLPFVTDSCATKQYFPFEYIGDITFSLIDKTVAADYNEREDLPVLYNYN